MMILYKKYKIQLEMRDLRAYFFYFLGEKFLEQNKNVEKFVKEKERFLIKAIIF